MARYLTPVVDGEVPSTLAPISEDRAVLTRYIKRLGYYLGADIVGICQLPQYAVYSHGSRDGSPIKLNHQYGYYHNNRPGLRDYERFHRT
jgi:hypothetical protein